MEQAINAINQLKANGVIKDYAVGGAIALLFYTEPSVTFDLDIFVFLPEQENPSPLISLDPIYSALQRQGYQSEKEHIIIGSVPVQFIPAYNPLVEEAVTLAIDKTFKGIPVRVLGLEYLIAIMLNTGRPKDKQRIAQLLPETSLDLQKLNDILTRFGLQKEWEAVRANP